MGKLDDPTKRLSTREEYGYCLDLTDNDRKAAAMLMIARALQYMGDEIESLKKTVKKTRKKKGDLSDM